MTLSGTLYNNNNNKKKIVCGIDITFTIDEISSSFIKEVNRTFTSSNMSCPKPVNV